MSRYLPGLFNASHPEDDLPDGEYLVRVARTRYRWHKYKPYYSIRFEVLEPAAGSAHTITGRLYCTAKALWKLSWFLGDFGYPSELLGQDEVDERALTGLTGVVKISHANIEGSIFLNLDGFCPADRWPEIRDPDAHDAEVA